MYEQKLRVRSDTLVVQLGIEPWLGVEFGFEGSGVGGDVSRCSTHAGAGGNPRDGLAANRLTVAKTLERWRRPGEAATETLEGWRRPGDGGLGGGSPGWRQPWTAAARGGSGLREPGVAATWRGSGPGGGLRGGYQGAAAKGRRG
jgi:hypothetical protein